MLLGAHQAACKTNVSCAGAFNMGELTEQVLMSLAPKEQVSAYRMTS